MAGLIRFNKALTDIRKKFGEAYSTTDFWDEYIISKEIDLFFKIDCCVCETIQRGLSDDGLFVYRTYPYTGYARISLEDEVFELITENKSSISISSITGFYNSSVSKITNIPALLFSKDLDCDHYNSLDEETIISMVSKEPLDNIILNINDLYLSKIQLNNLLVSIDPISHKIPSSTPTLRGKESFKVNLHPKEEKSIGLIIAALAQLAKIDISHPNGDYLRDKLLPLIQALDPDEKEMSANTLAKFINFAVKHTNIKTNSKTR